MPNIKPLSASAAPLDVRALYEEFGQKMGFPAAPNFILTQGHSATVARGTWSAVLNVLVLGQIPRWTKEMIFVAISRERGCAYCEAAHIACCRMLGVTSATLDGLVRNIESVTDSRLRDMINFSVKCSRAPRSVTAADYDMLRKHGLGESEIIELVGMSALAVYANIIADATAMEADPAFDELAPQRAAAGTSSSHT